MISDFLLHYMWKYSMNNQSLQEAFSSNGPKQCTEKENDAVGLAMAIPKEVLTHFH